MSRRVKEFTEKPCRKEGDPHVADSLLRSTRDEKEKKGDDKDSVVKTVSCAGGGGFASGFDPNGVIRH